MQCHQPIAVSWTKLRVRWVLVAASGTDHGLRSGLREPSIADLQALDIRSRSLFPAPLAATRDQNEAHDSE
jgi:hypothetical protein